MTVFYKMEEVLLTIESSFLYRVDDLLTDAGRILEVCLTGLEAVSLLVLVGLLNCLISHMHIMPSFENETMLFAI